MNVSKKDWDALVRFFRAEERVMRSSFGMPGNEKKTWEAQYKRDLPASWRTYDAARNAVARNRRKRKK